MLTLSSLQIAFKEWAVVVQALLSGRQTVILRKGGIVENKGQFSVDHQQFLFFPTYAHQNEEDLISEERENFRRLHQAKEAPDTLVLEGAMQVKQVLFLKDWAHVCRIQPFGIWSIKCLEERFHWGKVKGIHLIVGRVYRLPQPVALPLLQRYGGCKSWVELAQQISLAEAAPVLTDQQYEAYLQRLQI